MWNVIVIDESEKGVTSVVSAMIFGVSSHLIFFTNCPDSRMWGGGGGVLTVGSLLCLSGIIKK